MRILLIEDDIDFAESVGDFLDARGHEVDFAYDGLSGLHRAATERWDVVLLDLTLPGADGVDVCRRLRQDGGADVPIMMLTARDALEDKVTGFRAGADDYLVKPFALQELEVRLDALLRRGRSGGAQPLRVGDLVVDLATRTASRGGTPLALNRSCFKLLEALARAAPALVTREELERTLWGDGTPDGDRLRSHVYLLRRALDRPFERPLLRTVHGEGYRLAEDD